MAPPRRLPGVKKPARLSAGGLEFRDKTPIVRTKTTHFVDGCQAS